MLCLRIVLYFNMQVLNRNGLDCDGLETLSIKDQTLTNESKLIFCFPYIGSQIYYNIFFVTFVDLFPF